MTNSARLALVFVSLLGLAACADKPTPPPAHDAASVTAPGATGVCTPGADQTCNDDPAMSSLHGTCNPDRTCTCRGSFEKNPATGRCK